MHKPKEEVKPGKGFQLELLTNGIAFMAAEEERHSARAKVSGTVALPV